MIWVWAVLLVVVIGAIAVLTAGRDDAMVDVYDDRPDATLPTGRPLTADDLEAVRLSTAVRGYRMDEVDALLARLAADLRARQAREAAAEAVRGTALVEQRRTMEPRPPEAVAPDPIAAPRHAAAPMEQVASMEPTAAFEPAGFEPGAPLEPAVPFEPRAPLEPAVPLEPDAPLDGPGRRDG